MEEQEYWDDMQENSPKENCPRCGSFYDDIDFDYQSCSKCGWDAEEKSFSGYVRQPNHNDYLNGDADIITGQWI